MVRQCLADEGMSFRDYLKKIYENEFKGDDHQKFDTFINLVNGNDGISNYMQDQNIEIPSGSKEILACGGFIDSLTEEQAEKLCFDLMDHFRL